jgi:hypothetical protein
VVPPYKDAVPSSWCEIDTVHVYLHIDPGERASPNCSDFADLNYLSVPLTPVVARVLQAARKLYEVSWGKDLSCELQDISEDEENALKYLPKKYLDALEISQLGYSEGGLLVRAEYDAAWKELSLRAQVAKKLKCSGMVVAGQLGTGTLSLPIIYALLIIALIKGNPLFSTTCCFAY